MALLIAGFLSLIVVAIVVAIVKKKWALLFIPLGLVVVLVAFATLYSVSVPSQVVHATHNAKPPATTHGTSLQPTDSAHISVTRNTTSAGQYNVEGKVNVTRNHQTRVHSSPRIMIAPLGGFLIFLLPVGLIVLIVVAIIRKKWALLLIPLGVAGLAVIAVLVLRFVAMPTSSRNVYTQIETPDRNASPDHNYSIAADKPLPAVWSPGMETEFISDNYYSIPSALRGLAVRAEKKFVHGDQFPKKIAFVTYKDDFDENVLAKAVSFFQQLLPKTEFVLLSAGIDSIEGYDDRIALSVTYTKQPQNTVAVGGPDNIKIVNNAPASGKIRMDTHSNYSPSFVVGFQENPWLEDFDAYSNARPGNHYQIVYSQNPAGSWGSGIAQVESQAMQIVAERVSQVARSLPQYDGRAANYSISRDDLWDYGLVEGQFGQSLTGNASNISRQAILLNLLPQNVQRLAEKKLGIHNAVRQGWAYHILSAIGIAVVICVIYLILNAATKGYYTVVLRTLTIIGIIAVVIILLNLA
jgi:hypothetical protein